MGQDQHDNVRGSQRRSDRFELFYYERVGDDRYYLRFTRLALYLILGLTLVPIAGLFVFFLAGVDDAPPPVIRIDDPRYTPYPMPTLDVKPPPTLPTPRGKGAGASAPGRRRSPSPSPTPSATPAELPSPSLTQSPTPPGLPH